jgi:hypothetical protein
MVIIMMASAQSAVDSAGYSAARTAAGQFDNRSPPSGMAARFDPELTVEF